MKAVHNVEVLIFEALCLVIAHVKLQNESSSQQQMTTLKEKFTCDCSRKITK